MANPVKIPANVNKIEKYGDGVYLISLTPQKKCPRFKAGQFLHLTIDSYDQFGGFWPESRVFSIASPYSSETVEIVYSVKGYYTKRMEKELSVGKEVWLKLPYGDFTIDCSNPGTNIYLIAGGTGVSPYIPFLKNNLQDSTVESAHLIYGVRKKEHLLFRDLINECSSSSLKFKSTIFIENFTENKDMPYSESIAGTISLDYILNVSEKKDRLFYLSGPPGMIDYFKKGLLSNGIIDTNIKIDQWE